MFGKKKVEEPKKIVEEKTGILDVVKGIDESVDLAVPSPLRPPKEPPQYSILSDDEKSVIAQYRQKRAAEEAKAQAQAEQPKFQYISCPTCGIVYAKQL